MFAALNHFKPCDPDRPQIFNTIPVRPIRAYEHIISSCLEFDVRRRSIVSHVVFCLEDMRSAFWYSYQAAILAFVLRIAWIYGAAICSRSGTRPRAGHESV